MKTSTFKTGCSRTFITALSCMSLAACVSNSKHRELGAQHTKLQADYTDLEGKQRTLEQQNTEQAAWIRQLETRVGESKTDKARLEASLAETRKALEESARRKAEVEKRIAEYAELVRKFKALTDSGRLSVKLVDGRMVVAMSSDILFGSGSARLSTEGQTAIREVAGLLATIPGRKFQVEGHTDTIPIKTAQFPSNWELAAARSLTVVHEMVEAGLGAERVSAASFGEFKPARANDSKENRAANRRIEIVIVPDLSTLPGAEELERVSNETR